MRRVAASAVLALAMIAGSTSPAAADAPKFHSASSDTLSGGILEVTFDERGLGNETVRYILTADADAVYGCVNGGGKNPSAANKRTVQAEVSASVDLKPRNGRISDSLQAGPPDSGTFTCPSGQRLRLLSVRYTNIVLTDDTNGVSTDVPEATWPN